MTTPGQIIVLNGVPRSGKSSLAAAIQEAFDGVWMNLGVNGFKAMTPEACAQAIGARMRRDPPPSAFVQLAALAG